VVHAEIEVNAVEAEVGEGGREVIDRVVEVLRKCNVGYRIGPVHVINGLVKILAENKVSDGERKGVEGIDLHFCGR
jgi:hypothetical protein